MTAIRSLTLVVALAVAAVALVSRARRPLPVTSGEHAPAPPLFTATREASMPTTAPTPADVHAAIARAFSGCVETRLPVPESTLGDFNGDGSEDVAVVVQPTEGRSSEINDDFRNWVVQDLGNEPGATLGRGQKPRVEKGERLLAVVHGYGTAGWRNPEARQAYLLKNAVGATLRLARRAEAADATLGRPTLRGDAIGTNLDQGERFLFWTGARYALRR